MEFMHQIVVCCFNRPNYLVILLESLQKQTLLVNPEKITFVIDGYSNSSDEYLKKTNRTEETHALVKAYFPTSQIVKSKDNLGIPKSHDLALQEAFRHKGNWALMIEEDLQLADQALEIVQEKVLAQDTFPNETAIINLDNWKRLDGSRARGLYNASHGIRCALISRHFFSLAIPYCKLYLEYFDEIPYREKEFFKLVQHMSRGQITLRGPHSDELYSQLVDHFSMYQFMITPALANHIGLMGENENRLSGISNSFETKTRFLPFEQFSFSNFELTRMKLTHKLTNRFGLRFRIREIHKAIHFQGLRRTLLALLAKSFAQVVARF